MNPSQDQTIAFLSRAESYGRKGSVDRIDTHCAFVFLIGERAYKLKRSVKFLYLDYSTIELRERACKSEIILNRRTAPDIYLEARPINWLPDGTLTFGAEGEPVDWVVVMRRFSQDDLFDTMAIDHRLSSEMLHRLTDHVVEFHADAEIVLDHGGASAICTVIDGNLQSMARCEEIITQDIANQVNNVSLSALENVGPVLDARRISGHVRRCHGDLHLGNICLFRGEPTLFDCIEFSDEIACIDVYYDLAFLVMDLWQRGLTAEASLVFNRYCDMAGESPGLAAIPLFLSIRASLRAHVCAVAAMIQPSDEQRLQKEADAGRYLQHALQFLKAREPCMIALGGLSGTGKSTLARALAPSFGVAPGARLLRSDIVRKRIRNLTPETRLPESSYTAVEREQVYEDIQSRAAAVIACGYAVVVDAVFAQPEARSAIANVAKSAGVAFHGLWLRAPPSVLEPRLEQRQMDASDATVAVLRRQLDFDIGSLTPWQVIDASGDVANTLSLARAALSERSIDW